MGKARKDPKGRALRKGEIYHKEKGLYIYTYQNPFGKRTYVYSRDLAQLREKEDDLRKNQLDGLDLYLMNKADLNFVFDRYIANKSELRKNTYANYKWVYDHFVRDSFGKNKISEIKYSDVLFFYRHLLDKRNITVGSLENVHTVLHPTFDLAVRDDIIRHNPTDRVMAEIKKKKWGRQSGARHALTLEQQRAFMDALKEPKHHRWEPLFTVLLGTGCRVGELIGLRWEDIDLENRLININHSITYYARSEDTYKCEYEVSLPKTEAGIRVIPMLPAVHDAFLEEKAMQEALELDPRDEIDGMTGFIFCNRFGHIHNQASINRAIRRITEDYNADEILRAKKEKRDPIIIPHFSCHHLRHTFCTRFCENETNIKVIQSVMGHADIATTMNIYAEATERAKKESFENLAKNLDVFNTKRKESEAVLA